MRIVQIPSLNVFQIFHEELDIQSLPRATLRTANHLVSLQKS
jgi:hypothetical protein